MKSPDVCFYIFAEIVKGMAVLLGYVNGVGVSIRLWVGLKSSISRGWFIKPSILRKRLKFQ